MKKKVLLLMAGLFFISGMMYAQFYQMDSTFGNQGIARVGFGAGYSDNPEDILVLDDGKILTAGSSEGPDGYFIAIARHLSDGDLDVTGFGDSGKVKMHFVVRDRANAIALQQDGKIVAVGTQSVSNAGSAIIQSIYRFNADGTIDTTFGSGGYVALRYDGVSSGQFYSVKILNDGRILAAGSKNANANGGANGFGAMRFLSSGVLDSTFGTAGKSYISHSILFAPVGTAFHDDGTITFATTYFNTASQQVEYVMAKMDSTGAPDSSFGVNGIEETGITAVSNSFTKLEPTKDGKFLLGGSIPINTVNSIAVYKFNNDGTKDTVFGTSSRSTLNLTVNNMLYDIAIDQDEKIVLAGSVAGGFGLAILARLNADGSPDTLFADNGYITLDLNGNIGTHYLTAVSPQADGTILAAGYDFASNSGDFVITRLINNITDVKTDVQDPERFDLYQNYPNPFNPVTKIKYSIPSHNTSVSLKIFDVLGNEIATLVNEVQNAGIYESELGEEYTSKLASGVYIYKLQAGSQHLSKKLLLLK